jgi:hypothetical protein
MISIHNAKFGKGLFASVDIPKNTVITLVSGRPMTFSETIELKERESHSLQVGIDQYIMCEPPFIYSNHSCEPNCGLTPNLEVIALRHIKQGEELLWDYSTSMLERHWTMQCRCGSARCRNLVTDFDLLPEQLQDHYIRLNIVLPFILERMREAGLTYSYAAHK